MPVIQKKDTVANASHTQPRKTLSLFNLKDVSATKKQNGETRADKDTLQNDTDKKGRG